MESIRQTIPMNNPLRPYGLVLCFLFSFRLQAQEIRTINLSESDVDEQCASAYATSSRPASAPAFNDYETVAPNACAAVSTQAVEIAPDSVPTRHAAGSPYQLKWKRELTFIGATLAANTGAYLIHRQIQPLTEEKVRQLNRKDVWALDRGATRHYSAKARRVSDLLVTGSALAPGLALFHASTRRDFGKIATMQFETMLAVNGAVILSKGLAKRTRPLVYNPNVPLADKLTTDARQSFFSGHVANAAATSFFLATTFSQYFPESRLKPLVWTYAIACPAVTAYCRYEGGKHYLSDVVAGYLVGAATGILIPKIHRKLARKPRVIPD